MDLSPPRASTIHHQAAGWWRWSKRARRSKRLECPASLMAISVVMPALELAQETGKVLAWIKKEGDNVVKGEPLLEIETDKVSFELEAQAEGILAGIRSHEGDVVPVGQIIAWLVAPGEQPPVESDTASRGMAEQARPMTARAPEKAVEGGPRISP